MAHKQDLTWEERIKAAYLHFVLKVEQNACACAFEVNSGRVNEACVALLIAAQNPKDVRALWDEHLAKTRAQLSLEHSDQPEEAT